jgi:hypothetical protein
MVSLLPAGVALLPVLFGSAVALLAYIRAITGGPPTPAGVSEWMEGLLADG